MKLNFTPPVLAFLQSSTMDAPGWRDYLQVLAALAVTLGAVYVVLRHVLPRMQFAKPRREGLIRVRAACPLEPRKTLYLIEVGSETLLVGSAEHTISLLSAIPAGSLPEEIAPKHVSFADLLARRRA